MLKYLNEKFTIVSDEYLEFVVVVELDYGAYAGHGIELELLQALAVAFAQQLALVLVAHENVVLAAERGHQVD